MSTTTDTAITSESATREFDGFSSIEKRAIQLLSSGTCTQVQVAAATGLTEGRISQLVATPEVAGAIAAARSEKLEAANTRDQAYDALEDTLIERVAELLPFVQKPLEAMKMLATVNAAKRRGSGNLETGTQQAQVVQIMMPTQIIQKFTTNINNQVIAAGEQALETIQSGVLLRQTKDRVAQMQVPAQLQQQGVIENGSTNFSTAISENLGISETETISN